MNLFLAKLGKIRNMLKRNGWRRGSKVVAGYFVIFLKSFFVKNGDILYITQGVGDSARYRTYHQAEELRVHGIKASVTNQSNPLLFNLVKKFKIFIFHRTFVNEKLADFIQAIKKNQGEMLFETDDLVYDPSFLHLMDYYKKMSPAEKKIYENGVGAEIINDSEVKYAVTSTTFLAKKLEEKGKEVFLSNNKLSSEDLKWAEDIIKEPKEREDLEEIRMGYFSGTLSHNKDFAIISEAVTKLLEKYPNLVLYVAGPLDLAKKLLPFKNRIKNFPFVPRKQYFENLYKVDINLSPLEPNNPFCEAKSEIRFSEPGIVKVPTVAVRNQTFSEAITDGLDGFLAETEEEWIEKISRLIEDKNLRITMGEKAREKVLKDFSTKNSHNQEYYDFLKKKIAK